jgi:hypothetical protein
VGNTSYFIKLADSGSEKPEPTPAAVEPPTPENAHLYRAAVLAWRSAWREELRRHDGNHKLANPHVSNHASALAVKALTPEMTFEPASLLAHKATSWAAQAHHK